MSIVRATTIPPIMLFSVVVISSPPSSTMFFLNYEYSLPLLILCYFLTSLTELLVKVTHMVCLTHLVHSPLMFGICPYWLELCIPLCMRACCSMCSCIVAYNVQLWMTCYVRAVAKPDHWHRCFSYYWCDGFERTLCVLYWLGINIGIELVSNPLILR
mgnify:FL=1